MQVLEKHIEKPVVDWAKRLGIKVKKKMFGEQLDRWFMLPGGKPFIIEFKAPGKKATPLQKIEIDSLVRLGYDVQVHDNVDAAKGAIIQALYDRQRMGAEGVYEACCEILNRTGRSGAPTRPRSGEDKHKPSRHKNIEE